MFFFALTLLRIIRLIITESLDFELVAEGIQTKNIINKQVKLIQREQITGFRIERYHWNFVKIIGIQPFWSFESTQVVIFSDYRAILHFKSINYFGFYPIVQLLVDHHYKQISKRKRYFDRESYRFIQKLFFSYVALFVCITF